MSILAVHVNETNNMTFLPGKEIKWFGKFQQASPCTLQVVFSLLKKVFKPIQKNNNCKYCRLDE